MLMRLQRSEATPGSPTRTVRRQLRRRPASPPAATRQATASTNRRRGPPQPLLVRARPDCQRRRAVLAGERRVRGVPPRRNGPLHRRCCGGSRPTRPRPPAVRSGHASGLRGETHDGPSRRPRHLVAWRRPPVASAVTIRSALGRAADTPSTAARPQQNPAAPHATAALGTWYAPEVNTTNEETWSALRCAASQTGRPLLQADAVVRHGWAVGRPHEKRRHGTARGATRWPGRSIRRVTPPRRRRVLRVVAARQWHPPPRTHAPWNGGSGRMPKGVRLDPCGRARFVPAAASPPSPFGQPDGHAGGAGAAPPRAARLGLDGGSGGGLWGGAVPASPPARGVKQAGAGRAFVAACLPSLCSRASGRAVAPGGEWRWPTAGKRCRQNKCPR